MNMLLGKRDLSIKKTTFIYKHAPNKEASKYIKLLTVFKKIRTASQ